MTRGKADRTHEYRSEAVTVRWDRGRCIHAAECVRTLPQVFDPARRPWIAPDEAASAQQVAEAIHRCPTGALTYERHDGGAEEPAPEGNRGELVADGPIYLRGRIEVEIDGEVTARATRVALCRCGASQIKPFCDGSHQKVGFEAPATAGEGRCSEGELPPAVLRVQPAPAGPLMVAGPLELAAGGEPCYRGEKAALCRCGASKSKPFCDGSHGTIGFTG